MADLEPVIERKVEYGQPSAMPETKWFWRRFVTMLFTLLTDAILLVLVLKVTDSIAQKWIGVALVIYNLTMVLFYIGGATLTDIWQLVSAVRTSKTETVVSKGTPDGS